ncbi:MAG TPA: P-loop NTPase fold protein [Thermoanaerobaculia bacterium]|nr:P-loop NTPase fold protein [Thermoanaerobaculia bacterium]
MTYDGGRTWKNSRRHRIYPAPWYYLSLVLLFGFTWMALRRRQPSTERLSIADVLASDSPVDASQRDALNLDPLAQALSRFLRNENTQPPLTIAVTGEWGTGKSSLMNLLRDDLRRHGFHPVSFNAWHHQKEEHLLAALLENIRRQAIPAPWSRGGIAFRLRLLWIRGKRFWLLAFLILFAIAVYTGLFLADPSSPSARLEEVKQAAGWLASWFKGKQVDGTDSVAPGIAWLLGLGAVAETLRRGLRAFDIRPAQLLASASGSLKLSALEGQLGFREQFSREFRDVTRALEPRSMVILIDDLDRCRPENVSEILEAVNFLVSSGECVIVMGLDIDRVERAIGLAFRDVATEMLDRSSAPRASHIVIPGDRTETGASGGNPEDEELKLRRQRFARQYLEKLINIEVPVPRPNAEEFAGLFDVLGRDGWKPTPVAGFILKAAGVVRRWSLALLVLALLGAGFWVGFGIQRPAESRQVAEVGGPSPGPAPAPAPSSLPGKLAPPQPSPPPNASPGAGGPRLYEATPGSRSPAFLALPLGFLALLLVWRAIQAQEDIVRDSPQFVGALRTWTPFLFSKRNNPRSAKRFLNRVRYYAMFQRPYVPPVTPLHQLLIRLKLLRARDMLNPAVPIPEEVLVALSAIQHCEREWLSDGNLYTDFGGYLRQEGAPESLLEHLEEFQRWGSLERYRESFARVSTGIRVT